MKTKVNHLFVPVLLLAALVVVGLNTWVAIRAIDSLTDSQQMVDHTWQSINQVERIMGLVKDAETGNRGYLITGDEQYLEPYLSARRQLPADLDLFRSLTSNDPAQQANLVEMRTAIDRRLDLLERGVELRRSGGSDSSHALILSGNGKAAMDNLRRIADRMEVEQHRLLEQRTAATKSSGRQARYTLALASCLDFLLLVLMLRYFVREREMRVASERDAERLAVARAEAEKSADEVRALNATLEERVQLRTTELVTINHELEAFSYSVSHDLRAPLRTIDGFSLALEEDYAGVVDDAGKDYIRRVRSAVQRMGLLIDALLQLSRITRTELVREDFDLSEMAESIAADLKEQNHSVDLTIHIEPGLRVFADPRLLHIGLENLLGNAVKFSSKRPRAVVDFGWAPEQKAWFVRDNGAGFDMHYADKLFNAFNRLHGDKDFKGSGIGLATVARVVHRHHGRIWADSAVDYGATFWFTLG
ncbi:MAG: histidine kinase [Acidobacteriales bacterium 59-55]|nr:CHASE3 domain-containing protein [Terriglobales bacterium]OJV41311.1 MAG: histidine kinase [Acidobacteriales bacterium 59-55]